MNLKTLFRWHMWLGLFSGICMLIVGTSGAIAVFAEEIEWLATPPLRAHSPASAARADAETIVSKVKSAYPGARILSWDVSTRPSFCHVFGVQVRRDGGTRRLEVFADPGTGDVTGERVVSGGYTATLYQFIRQTHVRLLMGFWGRVFVGVLGVSLVLSCVTGLWIYRGWVKKMFHLRMKGGWGARPPWAELHKFVGVWSLLFNVLLGLTGAILGLENLTNRIDQKWINPKNVVKAEEGVGGEVEPGAASVRAERTSPVAAGPLLPLNTLLERAHAAFPDLTINSVTFPNRAGSPISFRGTVPAVLVAQSHVRSTNTLVLNASTGEVVRMTDGRNNHGWVRAYWAIDPLHFGYFGGLPTKIIWFVFGLTPGLLSVTGAVMWWRRRSRATAPKRAPENARGPSRFAGAITTAVLVAALVVGYVVSAKQRGRWAFSPQLAETWLVKPLTLGIVAFPLTILLFWLARRALHRPGIYTGACLLIGGWYVLLVRVLS